MKYDPTTILSIVEQGYEKNKTGIYSGEILQNKIEYKLSSITNCVITPLGIGIIPELFTSRTFAVRTRTYVCRTRARP